MIRAAIVGYGNIGRYTLEALEASEDFEIAGVVRRNASADGFPELAGYKVVSDITELGKVDVAILATPSRKVKENALKYLQMGINTVDSFDIHTEIVDLRAALDPVAKQAGAVSIISAGWDPGSDSMVRALLMAMAPKGLTYTNFGPGRSMGHTVAAKAIKGVKNALSMTIPLGTGIHRRMVYIELEEGVDFKAVEAAILADDYFAHDETHVIPVESIDALNNVAHGVNLVRNGVSGETHNQRFEFNMAINNPALTGQVMVSCARAAVRMKKRGEYGAKTMIELRPIDLLPGTTEELVKALV